MLQNSLVLQSTIQLSRQLGRRQNQVPGTLRPSPSKAGHDGVSGLSHELGFSWQRSIVRHSGRYKGGRKQVHEKVKMMSCRGIAASIPALKQVVQSVVNGREPFTKLAGGP